MGILHSLNKDNYYVVDTFLVLILLILIYIVLSSGCYLKNTIDWWLKQQKTISHRFWKQGAGMVGY